MTSMLPSSDFGVRLSRPRVPSARTRAIAVLATPVEGGADGAAPAASRPPAGRGRPVAVPATPTRPPMPPAPTDASVHAAALVRSLGRPLLGGHRVDLLLDGPETYAAMFEAIAQARDHINLESYMIEPEGPGAELAHRLAERARAGVRVNLLFDSVGSIGTTSAYFHRLERAGINVCEFHPLRRLSTLLTRALHLRDHRKLMVVDGRIGFIGGVNISKRYGSGPTSHADARRADRPAPDVAADPMASPWRDTHLRVEGPVVAHLQRLFTTHWRQASMRPMEAATYFPPLRPAGEQRVALAACDAGRRSNPFYRALLAAIDAAQHRVLITTAYLVPPRRLLRALGRAAQRGVEVHVLLPGVSDVWAALHAGRSHYARLLRAGVHIHERHDRFVHAKTCVIDGVWSTVGSSNFDWRSILHNAEANLLVLDAGLAARMERVFRDDVAAAREIEPRGWARRGWLQRAREALAMRFQFFL
jgi:cardiolipin synthase